MKLKPFDATDRRCLFPKCGKIIDDGMKSKGFTNTTLATKLGSDKSAVAGWRRGFARPNSLVNRKRVEHALGVTLDMSEPRPSEVRAFEVSAQEAANVVEAHKDDRVVDLPPVLSHIAALSLAFGYDVSFTPVRA